MLRTSTLCIGKVRAPHYDNLRDQLDYRISMPYIILDIVPSIMIYTSHLIHVLVTDFMKKYLKYVEASRVMAHASTLQ